MENEEFIALALAAGAAAHFRPNNLAQERPEVDAYLVLAEMIVGSYRGVDARMMEEGPGSEERRTMLTEQLESSGAAADRAVMRQSRRVLEKIMERAPQSITAVLVDEAMMRQLLLAAGIPVEDKPAVEDINEEEE